MASRTFSSTVREPNPTGQFNDADRALRVFARRFRAGLIAWPLGCQRSMCASAHGRPECNAGCLHETQFTAATKAVRRSTTTTGMWTSRSRWRARFGMCTRTKTAVGFWTTSRARATSPHGKRAFFLHVYPLRAADLPSAFARYVNLDFQWDDPDHKHRSYDAAKHACRISAVLPDFPIATIHTGQFRTGLTTRRLWEVRIRLAEVERLAPPAG